MAPSLTTQRGLPRKQPWFPCRRARPEQARSALKGWREVQERLRRRHLLCPRQHGRESGLHGNGSALSTPRAATHWRWWEGRGKASGWPRELGWWPHRRAHAESPHGGRAQWAGGDRTGSPWNRAEQGHRVRVSKKHSTGDTAAAARVRSGRYTGSGRHFALGVSESRRRGLAYLSASVTWEFLFWQKPQADPDVSMGRRRGPHRLAHYKAAAIKTQEGDR